MVKRYLFGSFAFVFGVIWALVGTVFCIASIVWFVLEYRIQSQGTAAVATVVEKLQTRDSDSDSIYSLRYVFQDQQDVEHTRTQNVSRRLWDRVNNDQPVDIVYMTSSPGQSRLARSFDDRWWREGAIFCAIGFPFAAIGWFLMIRTAIKARARIQLLRTGTPTTGRIIALPRDHTMKINGRHPMYISYEFTSPDGMVQKGRSINIPRKLENSFKDGAFIPVVYKPGEYTTHEPDIFGVRRSGQNL